MPLFLLTRILHISQSSQHSQHQSALNISGGRRLLAEERASGFCRIIKEKGVLQQFYSLD